MYENIKSLHSMVQANFKRCVTFIQYLQAYQDPSRKSSTVVKTKPKALVAASKSSVNPQTNSSQRLMIRARALENLYKEMLKCRSHSVATSSSEIVQALLNTLGRFIGVESLAFYQPRSQGWALVAARGEHPSLEPRQSYIKDPPSTWCASVLNEDRVKVGLIVFESLPTLYPPDAAQALLALSADFLYVSLWQFKQRGKHTPFMDFLIRENTLSKRHNLKLCAVRVNMKMTNEIDIQKVVKMLARPGVLWVKLPQKNGICFIYPEHTCDTRWLARVNQHLSTLETQAEAWLETIEELKLHLEKAVSKRVQEWSTAR
jgi:hypothetical protein